MKEDKVLIVLLLPIADELLPLTVLLLPKAEEPVPEMLLPSPRQV